MGVKTPVHRGHRLTESETTSMMPSALASKLSINGARTPQCESQLAKLPRQTGDTLGRTTAVPSVQKEG